MTRCDRLCFSTVPTLIFLCFKVPFLSASTSSLLLSILMPLVSTTSMVLSCNAYPCSSVSLRFCCFRRRAGGGGGGVTSRRWMPTLFTSSTDHDRAIFAMFRVPFSPSSSPVLVVFPPNCCQCSLQCHLAVLLIVSTTSGRLPLGFEMSFRVFGRPIR